MKAFNRFKAAAQVAGKHWAAQDPRLLEEAAGAVEAAEANPFCFTASRRQFELLAGEPEWAALAQMSEAARRALLGHWNEDYGTLATGI